MKDEASPAPIVIVEYDARWPKLAAAEAARLRAAAPLLVCVAHAGSTAVPGLGAKPIVDLVPLVAAEADLDACVPPLVALGYEYVPHYEDETPQRRFFRRRPRVGPGFNVHVVAQDAAFGLEMLVFRDALRADAALAAAYERLKRELAPRYTNVNDYADAKEFIRAALAARARH